MKDIEQLHKQIVMCKEWRTVSWIVEDERHFSGSMVSSSSNIFPLANKWRSSRHTISKGRVGMSDDSSPKRRHVFISHHHADDSRVDELTNLLARAGNDIRNSSVRMKPANQRRFDEGRVSEEAIRRVLRMKISWASTVVVLVGKETHTRPWVNWEIEQAHRQGKQIVGVYERGGTDVPLPKALEDYGTRIVGWNSDSIVAAIEGQDNPFENPDGSPRAPVHTVNTGVC